MLSCPPGGTSRRLLRPGWSGPHLTCQKLHLDHDGHVCSTSFSYGAAVRAHNQTRHPGTERQVERAARGRRRDWSLSSSSPTPLLVGAKSRVCSSLVPHPSRTLGMAWWRGGFRLQAVYSFLVLAATMGPDFILFALSPFLTALHLLHHLLLCDLLAMDPCVCVRACSDSVLTPLSVSSMLVKVLLMFCFVFFFLMQIMYLMLTLLLYWMSWWEFWLVCLSFVVLMWSFVVCWGDEAKQQVFVTKSQKYLWFWKVGTHYSSCTWSLGYLFLWFLCVLGLNRYVTGWFQLIDNCN